MSYPVRGSNKLVVGDAGGNVRVWELPKGKLLAQFKQQDAITAVDLAPNERSVLFGDASGRVVLWDLDKDRQERQYAGHAAPIAAVRYTADGSHAWTAATYAGTLDNSIRLWDLKKGKEQRKVVLCAAGQYLAVLAFSRDLKRALAGHTAGPVVVWNLETGKSAVSYSGHKSTVSAVSFSPGGKYALSGGGDTSLWLYRLPD